jgi:tetratricopeptide (TPR) repeat protein
VPVSPDGAEAFAALIAEDPQFGVLTPPDSPVDGDLGDLEVEPVLASGEVVTEAGFPLPTVEQLEAPMVEVPEVPPEPDDETDEGSLHSTTAFDAISAFTAGTGAMRAVRVDRSQPPRAYERSQTIVRRRKRRTVTLTAVLATVAVAFAIVLFIVRPFQPEAGAVHVSLDRVMVLGSLAHIDEALAAPSETGALEGAALEAWLARFRLARWSYFSGDSDDLAAAREHLGRAGEGAIAQMARAEMALLDGDVAAAEEAFGRAAQHGLVARLPSAHRIEGRVASARLEQAAAELAFRTGVEDHGDVLALVDLLDGMRRRWRAEEALERFGDRIRAQPDHELLAVVLAQLQAQSHGADLAAVEQLLGGPESAQLQPRLKGRLALARADALLAAGRVQDARRRLAEAQTGDPRAVELVVALARANRFEGRLDEAMAGLDDLLGVFPHEPAALVEAALVARARDQASALETRLGELQSPAARVVRAAAALGTGQPERTLEQLSGTGALGLPGEVELLEADAHHALCRIEQAGSAANRARGHARSRLGPNHPLAQVAERAASWLEVISSDARQLGPLDSAQAPLERHYKVRGLLHLGKLDEAWSLVQGLRGTSFALPLAELCAAARAAPPAKQPDWLERAIQLYKDTAPDGDHLQALGVSVSPGATPAN